MSPNMRALNIEVPTELKERLLAYCRRRGLPQAPAVRILLDEALTRAGFPYVEQEG